MRSPASTLAVSRTEKWRLSALRADFSMSESMRLASKVARLARPAPQLAPASPVFLVALGFSDDRDLCFPSLAQVESSASIHSNRCTSRQSVLESDLRIAREFRV